MLESRKYVPSYYAESRDFKVILKLLDYVVASYKGSVDSFVDLINPKMCSKKYLPLLADIVGYEYDSAVSEEVNRFIIGQYANLIRMRGSVNGIGFAIAMAIRAVQNTKQPMSKIFLVDKMYRILPDEIKDMFPDRELDMEETISVFLYSDVYSHKIWDLIRAVRPAGINVVVDNSKLVDTDALTQEINVSAEISKLYVQNSNTYKYTAEINTSMGDDNMTGWMSGVTVNNNKRQDVPTTVANNLIDESVYDESTKGNQSGNVGFVEVAKDK